MCYDALMRTTLTLDPDVAQKLRRRMVQERLTLKEAVNQTLRAGLKTETRKSRAPFKLRPHSFGFAAGIDLNKMNQLLDDLEVEDSLRKLRR